jgi:agmatine deiminase
MSHRGIPYHLLALVLLAASCTVQESRDRTPRSSTSAVKLQKPWRPKHLPKAAQRLARPIRAPGIGGSLHFDIYDDYRNLNITKFFITQAPVSAFRAPAEHEPSQACILSWPKAGQPNLNTEFNEVFKAAVSAATVVIVHEDAAHKASIQTQLTNSGVSQATLNDPTQVIWWQHPTNTIWARAFGPLSLVSTPATGTGKLSFVDFRFLHTLPNDDEIPTDLSQDWGVNVFRPDLDLEPDNFMVDGNGLCITTLATAWANPQMTTSAIEMLLQDYVGCSKLVWLEPMVGAGDPQLDMFAKLLPNNVALVGQYTQGQDPINRQILDTNAMVLTGNSLTVVRIPMPNNKTGGTPSVVWRSYINATLLDGSVNNKQKVALVPVYATETSNEAQALSVYQNQLPTWTVKAIPSDDLMLLHGAVHSITMQIPEGDMSKMEADPPDLCGPTQLACVTAPDAAVADGAVDAAVPDAVAVPDATPTPCGNISFEGCCDGNVVKFCVGSMLGAKDCAGDPQCGWDATNGWYDCGTAGGSDPSGTFPKSCIAVTDAAVPDASVPDLFTVDSDVPDQSPIADMSVPDLFTTDTSAPDQSVAADTSPAQPDASDIDPDGDDDGCSCHVGGSPSLLPFPPLLLLGLLLLVIRPR